MGDAVVIKPPVARTSFKQPGQGRFSRRPTIIVDSGWLQLNEPIETRVEYIKVPRSTLCSLLYGMCSIATRLFWVEVKSQSRIKARKLSWPIKSYCRGVVFLMIRVVSVLALGLSLAECVSHPDLKCVVRKQVLPEWRNWKNIVRRVFPTATKYAVLLSAARCHKHNTR